MTHYSFLDVGFTYRALHEEMDAAYRAVMDSGYYIGGKALDQFEAAYADWCGVRHCIGIGNGLEALILPLRARGIGPGDEVIVPANTFIATWLAVSQTGATVVPVDADPATMNIDLDGVARAITPRTRAIIAVHLYGAPVPMAGLRALAQAQDLFLLEDAAQAHGGMDHGRKVGALGHAAAFSFYPGKNLGAFGDAGALVTEDDALAQAVRMLSNYGSKVKYHHDLAGGNSRLDPLQAAFLSVKLKHLDAWTAQRRAIAAVYDAALAGLPDLRLPQVAAGTEPVWHLYVVRHPKRAALQAALADLGVPTALHYPVPNHHSGAYRAEFRHLALPVTEAICATCLSLPIGPHLSLDDATDIAARIEQAVRAL